MANKAYIEQLKRAILHLHKADAIWRETVPVHEVFCGQTVWKGNVEVFDLVGHPKAKRAFGWAHLDGEHDETERFVTVLEIPPVESAITAVRVSIVADGKKQREREKN